MIDSISSLRFVYLLSEISHERSCSSYVEGGLWFSKLTAGPGSSVLLMSPGYVGATTTGFLPSISSHFEFGGRCVEEALRRLKNKYRHAPLIAARLATPPTTPPAIAPAFVFGSGLIADGLEDAAFEARAVELSMEDVAVCIAEFEDAEPFGLLLVSSPFTIQTPSPF